MHWWKKAWKKTSEGFDAVGGGRLKMSLIYGLAHACASDPKRKGTVSKEVNAARKAMLDAAGRSIHPPKNLKP